VATLRKLSLGTTTLVLGAVMGSLGLVLLLTAGLPAWRRAGDTPAPATVRAQAALGTSPESESTEVARASDANDARLLFTELYKGGSSRGLVFSDKLVALHGKQVVMTGFMAPPLKPALDFFVLTRVPLSLCPFCASDAEWPEDIVFVRMPRGQTIQPTSATVRVTGQLDIGNKTDEATGFVSLVRIDADHVQVSR
jgi:hypothetical protein